MREVDDTRGILDPAAMMRRVAFKRYDAGGEFDGLVAWFWSVRWNLPEGTVHQQQVLNHPAGHISVGTVDDAGVPLDPAEGRMYPMLTGVSERRLTGVGWTVAARTSVGGAGVFLDGPVKGRVDSQLALTAAIPGLEPGVIEAVSAAAADLDEGVARLGSALAAVVESRPADVRAEARWVGAVAGRAEEDRSIARVEELAADAGVSVRTLQRLFDHHIGVSPSFVIRRWRLIEAAEAAQAAIDDGADWAGWADVAARLGYSDQAHLSRDFSRHLGATPSAYVARNRADASGAEISDP